MDRRHLLLAALAAPGTARAQHAHTHAPRAEAPACTGGALGCADVATPAFGPDGRLFLAWAAGGRVLVAHSTDLGRTLSAPVAATSQPMAVDANGEARPKLLALPDGALLLAWTVRRDRMWNGQLVLSRSTDGGHSWSAPRPMLADGVSPSQRFETLALGPDGRLWAVWLDKRNLATSRAPWGDRAGAGIALAVSEDGGRTFSESRIIHDNTCECCRIALSFDAEGLPVLAWRNIYGRDVRDHAMARIGRDGRLEGVQRVSQDNWAIEACPHHGPANAVDGSGRWHVAWWSGGGERRGLFYARSADAGRSFTPPRALGAPARQSGHAQLLAFGERVLLAWREFDGERMRILGQRSADGGTHWSAPEVLAETPDTAEQPRLVAQQGRAYLSWLTRAESWRFLPVALDGRA